LRRDAESRPPWRASTKRLNELDRKANDRSTTPVLTVFRSDAPFASLRKSGFSENVDFNADATPRRPDESNKSRI
jgi:hypothetical protein